MARGRGACVVVSQSIVLLVCASAFKLCVELFCLAGFTIDENPVDTCR